MRKGEKFKFYSKSDVGTSADIPTTFAEAIAQAKNLPSRVKATNNGKGVPQKFTFTPIKTVRQWMKFESGVDIIFQNIKEETLTRVVSVSQDLAETERKLAQLKSEFLTGKNFMSDKDFNEAIELVGQFATEQSRFKETLQTLLKDIRSGNKEVSELEKAIGELEKSKFSKTNIEGKVSF